MPSPTNNRKAECLRREVDAVIAWQTTVNFHPLTCGTDSRHALLQPKVLATERRVILVCPTCFYAQGFIPSIVFQAAGLKVEKYG